ncbi:MAG: photosynthetic reaction center cytochrome PufC [Alphaproteobacteria bacterium]
MITNKQFNLITGILIASTFAVGYIVWKTGWDFPPVETVQNGFRGTAMVQVRDMEDKAALDRRSVPPEVPFPASDTGPKAKEQYPDLQYLGDLSEEQFNRLMLGFAEWVAPKEGDNAGCAYCHKPENMADRSLYTHQVAQRMIQMTRTINSEWKAHVANTGVTCYTCHRGQPVPANIWFSNAGPNPPRVGESGWVGWRNGQNVAAPSAGLTSLPYDSLSAYLRTSQNPTDIRVTPTTALPTGSNPTGIMDAEKTYALMIHMSQSLGVNCTFCHNSRAFNAWDQSPPQRVTAWHGIRMARTINQTYMEPLQTVFPANRLGPQGDSPKVGCSTCHNGLSKPLNGAQMLRDYLAELGGPQRR